jgi:hypothetical protein
VRALATEVVDAVFAAIEPLLPEPPVHPLGCHRPRVPDRLCFWGFPIRLTTGSSWVDIEAILELRVSDTTLRTCRDEWITAGVSDQLCAEAIAAFDRIIGVDLSEFAIDGSACLRRPSPRSPPTAGSTRSTPSTSTAATTTPRSDANSVRPASTITPGLRWIVEATNSWLSNYGQLRRNTDRKSCHRHAALCLATTALIVGKLLSWRDRWDPRWQRLSAQVLRPAHRHGSVFGHPAGAARPGPISRSRRRRCAATHNTTSLTISLT